MQKKEQLGFAAGFVFGALAMYYGDPHRGAYRRAVVKDKGVHYRKLIARRTVHAGRDILYRGKGFFARARSKVVPQRVDDDILIARISSRLGRVIWNPHRIELFVKDGKVRASGRVLPREFSVLMETIRGTPGVRGVENRLDVSKAARA